MPGAKIVVSEMTTTSQASRSRSRVRNASKFGELISSSPSITTLTLIGSEPRVRRCASSAARCMST